MSDVPNALMYVINIMTRDGVHFTLCSTHTVIKLQTQSRFCSQVCNTLKSMYGYTWIHCLQNKNNCYGIRPFKEDQIRSATYSSEGGFPIYTTHLNNTCMHTKFSRNFFDKATAGRRPKEWLEGLLLQLQRLIPNRDLERTYSTSLLELQFLAKQQAKTEDCLVSKWTLNDIY